MTQPAPVNRWGPGYTPLVRLLAAAAVIACLVAGFIIAFSTLTAKNLQTWTAVGIIAAGVFGACLIFL